MLTLKPLTGHLVKPEWADTVVAPAYDSMLPTRRAEFARQHPDNYVNTMRSPEEFPADKRPTSDKLIEHNLAQFRRVLDSGHYGPIEQPGFFVYRLDTPDHRQTGVVANVAIEEYERRRIRIHERTQEAKESDLVRYQQVVGASSSPVALAYRDNEQVAKVIEQITRAEPILRFRAHDDVLQTIWSVSDSALERSLAGAFARVDCAYLTDGHHRSAALAEFARQRRAAGETAGVSMLVALFPQSELRILPYHRAIRIEPGTAASGIIDALEEGYEVTPVDEPGQAVPPGVFCFGMWLDGDWYALRRRARPRCDDDPVKSLDVSLLVADILEKVFDVGDCRSDSRLSYVAGSDGLGMLEAHCRETQSVGFACYPTSLTQLMAVADAGEVMPPKSTWFDPKVRSGIFITRI